MNPRRPMIWPRSHRVALVAVGLVLAGAAVAYPDEGGPAWVRVVCTAVLVGGGLVGLAALVVLAPRHADGGTLWARPERPADEAPDPRSRHELTRENTGDEVTADSVAAGGGTAGFWDGLALFGPGYDGGPVMVRHASGAWAARPGADDDEAPVSCGACGTATGMTLVWPQDRPDLALFACPCGRTWRDPAWATPDGVALVLAQDAPGAVVEVDGADVDPAVSYLGETLRREAGNTPPPPPPSSAGRADEDA